MTNVFMNAVQFSIQAGFLVLALLILRLILKKAPRFIICALWALVAIRLIVPFQIESMFSVAPATETLTIVTEEQGYAVSQHPDLQTTIIDAPVSGTPVFVATSSVSVYEIASYIWIAGIVVMLMYAVISYLRLRRMTSESVEIEKGVCLCDRIPSPFILGVIRPKIFLPSDISEHDKPYVLAHERAHIKRRDHLWKPLGFLLLSVYWFNPLLWVAYVLLCRDIEMACDEKVIRELGFEVKKPYAIALINAAAPRRMITSCPLAFGEVGVKSRIKNVLSYKKPTFWIIIAAAVIGVAVGICFLTSPVAKRDLDRLVYQDDKIEVSYLFAAYHPDNYPSYLTLRVKNPSQTDIIRYAFDDVRLYKNGVMLSPSGQSTLEQGERSYRYGTNIVSFDLDAYDDQLDENADYLLELDYYVLNMESDRIADIDPSGTAKIDFRFEDKDSRVDLPDVVDDVIYYDVDGDGTMDLIILSPGPTSGLYSEICGVYDAATRKQKYPSSMLSGSGPVPQSFEISDQQLYAVAYNQGIDAENLLDKVYYEVSVKKGETALTERLIKRNGMVRSKLNEIASMNVATDLPQLIYADQDQIFIYGAGDCGLLIYDLSQEQIVASMSTQYMQELGVSHIPVLSASADGEFIYVSDFDFNYSTSELRLIYNTRTHEIKIPNQDEKSENLSEKFRFGYLDTSYDFADDGTNLNKRIYRKDAVTYELMVPDWKMINMQVMVKTDAGTAKEYKIFRNFQLYVTRNEEGTVETQYFDITPDGKSVDIKDSE